MHSTLSTEDGLNEPHLVLLVCTHAHSSLSTFQRPWQAFCSGTPKLYGDGIIMHLQGQRRVDGGVGGLGGGRNVSVLE